MGSPRDPGNSNTCHTAVPIGSSVTTPSVDGTYSTVSPSSSRSSTSALRLHTWSSDTAATLPMRRSPGDGQHLGRVGGTSRRGERDRALPCGDATDRDRAGRSRQEHGPVDTGPTGELPVRLDQLAHGGDQARPCQLARIDRPSMDGGQHLGRQSGEPHGGRPRLRLSVDTSGSRPMGAESPVRSALPCRGNRPFADDASFLPSCECGDRSCPSAWPVSPRSC